MNPDFLKFLACPDCGQTLNLKIFEEKNGQIIEGLLSCPDGSAYPIIRSIPRIFPDALMQFNEFSEKYHPELQGSTQAIKGIKEFKKKNKQTRKAFEFQWKIFGHQERLYGRTEQEQKDYFFHEFSSASISPEFFKNKLVLEGGCGHGTFLKFIGELGAEMIGIDLGLGIEVAAEKCKHLPNVHLVQGSLLHPPLQKRMFDYVYSTGVIHHTPDTRHAFTTLAKAAKPEGHLAVWVYPKGSKPWEITNKLVRSFTTRIPPKILYPLSFSLVPLLYFFPPYSGTHPKKNTWKECVQCIYDWLSPKYQTHHTYAEIESWFQSENFTKIERLPLPVGVAGIKRDQEAEINPSL